MCGHQHQNYALVKTSRAPVCCMAFPELTTRYIWRASLRTGPYLPLDSIEQRKNNVLLMFMYREADMLKVFVEEAAALASIVLFVGMIAVWAQLIPQL